MRSTGCANARPVDHQVTRVQQPPAFGDGGAPVRGIWIERVAIDRCGQRASANILSVATGGGLVQMDDLLPGATRLGANEQRDEQTVMTLFLAAKSSVPDCDDTGSLSVTDTAVVSETNAVKYDDQGSIIAGNWEELWTAELCGRSVPIHLLMGPNEEGALDVVWLKS
jgi:hypothetical protein